jgi:hypothetical protein
MNIELTEKENELYLRFLLNGTIEENSKFRNWISK